MNGYFKGFMPNETENSSGNASGVKEPPKMRMQTMPNENKNVPKNEQQISKMDINENVQENNTRENNVNNNSGNVVNPKIADIENFNNSLGRGIENMNDMRIPDDYANPEFSERESIEEGQNDAAIMPYSGRGSIIVQVFMARRALPLENVKITITSAENAPIDVNEILFTGDDGKTEEVFLPTPDLRFSTQAQTTVPPYAVYNIKAELNGYHTEEDSTNALVFDKVRSIQNIDMTPNQESGV